MPIPKPFRHLYRGPQYEAFRAALLDRAGNACEQCKAPNHARVFRANLKLFKGWWWDEILGSGHDPRGNPQAHIDHVSAVQEYGAELRGVRIVLTAAHLNQTPGDDRLENGMMLCQWRHLNYDMPVHLVHSRETRCGKKDPLRPLLVAMEVPA